MKILTHYTELRTEFGKCCALRLPSKGHFVAIHGREQKKLQITFNGNTGQKSKNENVFGFF